MSAQAVLPAVLVVTLLLQAFLPRFRLLIVLAGCNRGTTVGKDPLEDVRNPRLNKHQRTKAIHAAWAQAEAGDADRISVREELKTVAWASAWPIEMRMAALEHLAGDTTEKGSADTRSMFRLMLPRENDRAVTAFLCERVAARLRQFRASAGVRSTAELSLSPTVEKSHGARHTARAANIS